MAGISALWHRYLKMGDIKNKEIQECHLWWGHPPLGPLGETGFPVIQLGRVSSLCDGLAVASREKKFSCNAANRSPFQKYRWSWSRLLILSLCFYCSAPVCLLFSKPRVGWDMGKSPQQVPACWVGSPILCVSRVLHWTECGACLFEWMFAYLKEFQMFEMFEISHVCFFLNEECLFEGNVWMDEGGAACSLKPS